MQGAVLQVRNRPLAVKISSAATPAARRRVMESIARVKRLPLKGLKVARPLWALAPPHVGYVMELMTGMQSLSVLTVIPKKRREDFVPWYIETGSLRRRLRLLANIAENFAALHARGLCYGDASPGNIFISEDLDAYEAWLIDCDNVTSGVNRRVVYTPGYAAPELFRSRPSDALTDAWSLAVLIFETLTTLHPFNGDVVHDGEPEMEEQAFEGRFPWVDDPSGENEASRGIPRELVLSRDLRKLSEECFGASRTDRLKRPGAASWAEKLHSAADLTLTCTECESSFYISDKHCPWCDTPRPAFVLVEVWLRDLGLSNDARTPLKLVVREPGRPKPFANCVVQQGVVKMLDGRLLLGKKENVSITLRFDGTQIFLASNSTNSQWLVRHKQGRQHPVRADEQRLDLSRPREWWLVPERPEQLHRVVSFRSVPAVSA
jgi:DNA-binding helix-hairpin-helix protein with protein kinase domain